MTTTTKALSTPPAAALNARANDSSRKVVERSFTPDAAIPDRDAVSFTFVVNDDFRIGEMELDVDIAHAHRPDLVVTLTSPSGKKAVVSDRGALPFPDLKATFDLGAAFEREASKGEWKLTVEDQAKGDTGTLKSWKVRMQEGEARTTAPRPGAADDETVYSGTVKIDSSQSADGRFQLYDKSRGQGVETRDGMDTMSTGSFKPVTDSDDVWGGAANNPRHKSAIDAQYAGQVVYDYMRDVLGRDSLDGKGEKIVLNVHMGQDSEPKTLWNGASVDIVENENGESWTSVDMIGRQLLRGMVERVSDLKGPEGEEWAVAATLRAALGGVGVEWYAAQSNPELAKVTDPYLVGEQIKETGSYKPTDFADPTTDGESIDNYENYNPDEDHFVEGLGIGTNAFYLLTHGGVNKTSGIEVQDAIGIERGLKIFNRAVDHIEPGANFAKLRKATIDAASELYGATSKDVQKVREAWTAVGVK